MLRSTTFALLACALAACAGPRIKPPALEREGWTMTWHDEFDGAALDRARWNVETSSQPPANAELQCYSDRPANVRLEDGSLVITALREEYRCSDGPRRYTSGRLNSLGKFAQLYGRFEARMKIPRGQGMWPAFWMMGDDIERAGWPGGGEIDVMENIGKEPNVVHGTIHGPGYSGDKGIGGERALPVPLADGFHVYAVEWQPEKIDFFIDDVRYATRVPADLPAGKRWVYDHPFFLIVNLAVGGGWPGDPDATTVFPQQLLVDYVRVYRRIVAR